MSHEARTEVSLCFPTSARTVFRGVMGQLMHSAVSGGAGGRSQARARPERSSRSLAMKGYRCMGSRHTVGSVSCHQINENGELMIRRSACGTLSI